MYRVNQDTLFVSRSLGANFISPNWDIRGLRAGCIEIAWTGIDATNATFKLEGSGTGVVWCDLKNTTYTIDATGSGDHVYEIPSTRGFNYIRINYTANSATTGTMTAVTVSKYERNGDNPGTM